MANTRIVRANGSIFRSFISLLMRRGRVHGDAGARRVAVAAVSNPKSPYRKFWAMVITD